MKKTFIKSWLPFILLGCFMLTACRTPKNIAYFQDLSDTSKIYSQEIKAAYEVHIQPDDVIEIYVNSINPQATAPFNLGNGTSVMAPAPQVDVSAVSGSMLNTSIEQNAGSKGYLVDKNGMIDFPVLGKLKVQNYTVSQLKDTLRARLDAYLSNPIVNARLLNYKITVLGEVVHPAAYAIPSERISVMDAIGMAGDLTIYGRRENILLVREENGQRKFIRLNLNSSKIFESPYYYLKQNDLIYVEPNNTKIVSSDATKIRNISLITAGLSLLIIIVSRIK